jgi:hypothetical protein
MVSHIEGGASAKGGREWGAEKIIERKRRLEKVVH